MWLSKKIARGGGPVSDAQTGVISLSDGENLYALGTEEVRDVPIFGPCGYRHRPAQGEEVLLLPVGDGYACVGVRSDASGLQPGEVEISACGARITLRRDGSVDINGLVITRDGELLPKR